MDAGESAYQSIAITRLEFVEATAVDDSGDYLSDIVGCSVVLGNDSHQVLNIVRRLLGGMNLKSCLAGGIQILDDISYLLQRRRFVFCIVVSHTRFSGVHISSSQFFGADNLTGSGLDQWWSGEEDRAVSLDDDGFVRHRRNIGTTGGTGA